MVFQLKYFLVFVLYIFFWEHGDQWIQPKCSIMDIAETIISLALDFVVFAKT